MKNTNKKIKVLLTGGGSGGPVSPLLALVDEARVKKKNWEFFWIGTEGGPEKKMVDEAKIKFKVIFGGKLRRYFSIQNFIDPFKIFIGFLQSIFFILKWKPNLVMSAGGFVSVPVAWAAWILRVPVLIHQQDARPGLSNKLMAPVAKVITVTFEKSLKDFGKKAILTGNPTRRSLRRELQYRIQKTEYNLKNDLQILLVVGGGQGALGINKLVEESLDELTEFCQIIHIVGKGKNSGVKKENYQEQEFLVPDKMAEVLNIADAVVSRAGLGLLTELSYLRKPSIIIPMPDSHQEDNAQIFKDADAAIVLDQKNLDKDKFVKNIKNVLLRNTLRNKISDNIARVMKKGGSEAMIVVIEKILKI